MRERTSIVPFQAVLEGRQQLPRDYYKELLRAPYLLIAAGTLGAYAAHPYMQAGAALVRNTGLVEGGILDGLFKTSRHLGLRVEQAPSCQIPRQQQIVPATVMAT